MEQHFNDRTQILLGQDATQRLSGMSVIVFGIGGVGSWCAEALARTGIGNITLVDNDVVSPSNINRQLVAMQSTIGMPKVEVMARRILDINPRAHVTAVNRRYNTETADEFNLGQYDYVVDAIDSLADKALLILRATSSDTTLVSSMGAALKTDPTRVSIAEFWKVEGCPLARALRQRFKRSGIFPRHKFYCVYSPQLVPNLEPHQDLDGSTPNGSLIQVTAVFGMTLASIIINKTSQHTS